MKFRTKELIFGSVAIAAFVGVGALALYRSQQSAGEDVFTTGAPEAFAAETPHGTAPNSNANTSELVNDQDAQAAEQAARDAINAQVPTIDPNAVQAAYDQGAGMGDEEDDVDHAALAECHKAHASVKAFASYQDLRQATLKAFQTRNSGELAKLLPCGTWVGVPESEYDQSTRPDQLAESLVSLAGPVGEIHALDANSAEPRLTLELPSGATLEFEFDGTNAQRMVRILRR